MSLLGTKWSSTMAMCSLSNTLSKPGLFKLVDGHRGGDIVAQHDVELGVDELARLDLGKTCVCGQNFLRQGHSHDTTLLLSFRLSYRSACACTLLMASCTQVPWRCTAYDLMLG